MIFTKRFFPHLSIALANFLFTKLSFCYSIMFPKILSFFEPPFFLQFFHLPLVFGAPKKKKGLGLGVFFFSLWFHSFCLGNELFFLFITAFNNNYLFNMKLYIIFKRWHFYHRITDTDSLTTALFLPPRDSQIVRIFRSPGENAISKCHGWISLLFCTLFS